MLAISLLSFSSRCRRFVCTRMVLRAMATVRRMQTLPCQVLPFFSVVMGSSVIWYLCDFGITLALAHRFDRYMRPVTSVPRPPLTRPSVRIRMVQRDRVVVHSPATRLRVDRHHVGLQFQTHASSRGWIRTTRCSVCRGVAAVSLLLSVLVKPTDSPASATVAWVRAISEACAPQSSDLASRDRPLADNLRLTVEHGFNPKMWYLYHLCRVGPMSMHFAIVRHPSRQCRSCLLTPPTTALYRC